MITCWVELCCRCRRNST